MLLGGLLLIASQLLNLTVLAQTAWPDRVGIISSHDRAKSNSADYFLAGYRKSNVGIKKSRRSGTGLRFSDSLLIPPGNATVKTTNRSG